MRKPRFPEGWDEGRVAELIAHYEGQSDEEAVAEDEAAMYESSRTVMETSTDPVPAARDLIANRRCSRPACMIPQNGETGYRRRRE